MRVLRSDRMAISAPEKTPFRSVRATMIRISTSTASAPISVSIRYAQARSRDLLPLPIDALEPVVGFLAVRKVARFLVAHETVSELRQLDPRRESGPVRTVVLSLHRREGA